MGRSRSTGRSRTRRRGRGPDLLTGCRTRAPWQAPRDPGPQRTQRTAEPQPRLGGPAVSADSVAPHTETREPRPLPVLERVRPGFGSAAPPAASLPKVLDVELGAGATSEAFGWLVHRAGAVGTHRPRLDPSGGAALSPQDSRVFVGLAHHTTS